VLSKDDLSIYLFFQKIVDINKFDKKITSLLYKKKSSIC